jgi:hypothetical protein
VNVEKMVRVKKNIENDCLNKRNRHIYTPPNSFRDPNVGPRMKQQKKKKVKACSIIESTCGIGGHAGVPRWD